MKYKTCKDCHRELPATKEYFYRVSGSKNRFHPRCIPCMRDYTKLKYYERKNKLKNEEKGNDKHERIKACSKCGIKKPATTEYFHRRATSKDGLDGQCKTCKRESARKRQQKKSYENRKRTTPTGPKDYKVGQQIKIRRQITPQQRGTMTGWVAGIYDHFILVRNKHYSECFTYADLTTGEAEIRKC